MEKEFETTKECKEGDSKASSFTKTSTCVKPSQGKEPEHNKSSSYLGAVRLVESIDVTKSKPTEMSKSNTCRNEPSSTEGDVTGSEEPGCIITPEIASRTAEYCNKSFEVTKSSLKSIDSVKESLSLNALAKKSKDIQAVDTSKICDATVEKQNSEKECKISSLLKTGEEINDSSPHQDELALKGSGTMDDCDKQQDIASEDSCNDKQKSKDGSTANTLGQNSPKEPINPYPVTNPVLMRKRKHTQELDNQGTATITQNISSKDVDAEWSIDEKKRLLAALESDAGKRHWSAIVSRVKTKNIRQVKYFTENLLAQAKGTMPVHLVGDRDNQLQEWITLCERLKGGQEDIDAKCIPQVMTIAAVEPSSSPEGALGPNYARIYNFLSCVLRGQATVGLTPIDAKVVLELIQSLEIKIMNADLHKQQSFLKNKYTSIVKDLEQEQIVFAVEELQKQFLGDEAGETNTEGTSLNNYAEGSTSKVGNCQFSSESIERSDTSEALPTCSSNAVQGASNLDEARKDETSTSVDVQTEGLRSPVFPPSGSFIFPEPNQTKSTNNMSQSQASPTDSDPSKMTETTKLSLSSNMVDSRSPPRIRRPKRKVVTSVTEYLRKQKESRRLKLKKMKNELNKPKLSSLNPVCIPVSLLNVKPKSSRPQHTESLN